MDEANGSARAVSYTRSFTPSFTPTPIHPPSSPIHANLAGGLNDFIDWVINERPYDVQKFENARSKLHEEEISMEQIQATKDGSEWIKYSIASGTGWLLSRQVKPWERSQRQLRSSATPRATTPPPPTRSLAVRPSPRKQKGGVMYTTVEADSQANIETQDEDEEYQLYSPQVENVNAELYTLDNSYRSS